MRRSVLIGRAAAALIIMSSTVYAAGEDAQSLQATLNLLNQEQQALYQQFQMIQQLRRANAESASPPVGGGPPGNYEDMIANRQARADRDDAYARELQDLYRRHRELEREKQPIIESLRRLRQEKQSPAAGG